MDDIIEYISEIMNESGDEHEEMRMILFIELSDEKTLSIHSHKKAIGV